MVRKRDIPGHADLASIDFLNLPNRNFYHETHDRRPTLSSIQRDHTPAYFLEAVLLGELIDYVLGRPRSYCPTTGNILFKKNVASLAVRTWLAKFL